eukprot:805847-Prorocentrum_minimum.AAC.1
MGLQRLVMGLVKGAHAGLIHPRLEREDGFVDVVVHPLLKVLVKERGEHVVDAQAGEAFPKVEGQV